MAHTNNGIPAFAEAPINTYRMVPVYHGRVQACIFDWAGKRCVNSKMTAYLKNTVGKIIFVLLNSTI